MGGPARFIIMDVDSSDSDPRNRTLPVILDVPEEIGSFSDKGAKEILLKVVVQKIPERRWRWNKKFAISESDSELSPEISMMFSFVDWNSAPRIWFDAPSDPSEALNYVKTVGLAPSVEHLLASNSATAYQYSMDILEGKFLLGEKAIAEDPVWSVNYAKKSKSRIVAAEGGISESEELAFIYGKIMKEHGLWGSWSEDEVSRSPVWMYQYAKDYVGGPLPEMLHTKMHLGAFSDSDNKWIKKYLGAKKYLSRKTIKRA